MTDDRQQSTVNDHQEYLYTLGVYQLIEMPTKACCMSAAHRRHRSLSISFLLV